MSTELLDLLAASVADPSARTPLESTLKTGAAEQPAHVSPERRAWLEARRSGVGASEIAAILGLDPFRGPLDTWLSKVEKTSNCRVLRFSVRPRKVMASSSLATRRRWRPERRCDWATA